MASLCEAVVGDRLRVRPAVSGKTLAWSAMWVTLVAYCIALAFHGKSTVPLVDCWLSNVVYILPTAACWIAARRNRSRRLELSFLAAAATAFTIGNIVYNFAAAQSGSLPFPSVADIGFLSFYVLILASLIVAVRRELRHVRAAVWLDSLLGSLGAAGALAVVLQPVLEGASGGTLAQVVALAYPLFDMLLIATVVGIAALHGWRLRSSWSWPFAGLSVFTAADVVYALRVAHNAYAVGTILDALWPVGLTLLAVWAGSAAQPRRPEEQRAMLAVPVAATLVSVIVLLIASRVHVDLIAVVLAGLTLLAAAGRTHVAFRGLRRLADLRRQATTDELTELPNRRALYARVTTELSRSPVPRALLLLDLDRFKEINDSLGHHAGDQLLIQAAARLRETLREADMLARLGGDEFAVLLDDCDEAEAVAVAMKLRAMLASPITLDGIALQTGVSIGIALSPVHGNDVSLLLRKADIAMYKAKHDREGVRVFDEADDTHGQARLRTLEELRIALTEGQLLPHFQPKVQLGTGEVHGVEALVRWDHPTRGLLYPDTFLQLVEDGGLMHRLTQQVIELALDQAACWHADGRQLSVAVNLSPSSLLDAELPDYVAAQLADRGLPACSLQLEITEATLMADRDQARVILDRLSALGVHIAVDDFGTGYSSLAYLRELPIDELKLDRSFVFPMADDARAAAIVESTIGLAHSLGMRLIAEGVEDGVTYRELARYGCDQVQGFYISRPVPAAELDHWLSNRTAEPNAARAPALSA